MCIFYLLHEITGFHQDVSEGKRNSRIFIIGIILYCLLYIFLCNLWDKNYFSQNITDAIFWCGMVLFIADISIMAYTYKNYYGRSIVNEMTDDTIQKWYYDDKGHKYYSLDELNKYKDTIIEDLGKKENMSIKVEPKNVNLIKILENLDNKSKKSNKSNRSKKSNKSKKSIRKSIEN